MTQQMFLDQLLKLLSANRKFPKYQHERRIDLFVNFFLPEILDAEYGTAIDFVVPEFPLKNPASSLTTNVDYFAYSSKDSLIYLCEFKTNAKSFDEQQLERYFQAQQDGWSRLFEDIEAVSSSTAPKHREKYAELRKTVQAIPPDVDITVVYIAPEATRSKLDAFVSRKGFSFLSLESLATLRIDTSFVDEWNLVRSNLQ